MLKIKNLTIIKDKKELLKNAHFEIKQGEIIFLSGNNGSGKSIFVKSLLGLEKYEGEIFLQNVDIKKIDNITSKISVIFQNIEDYFFATTVEDELAFTLENHGVEEEIIKKLIKDQVKKYKLDFPLLQNPNQLSGGQKQRLAIAAATINKPQLLTLDETLSMNGYDDKEKILKQLKSLNNSNVTIIIISHNLEDLDVCDRVIYLEKKNFTNYSKKDFIKKISKGQ